MGCRDCGHELTELEGFPNECPSCGAPKIEDDEE